MSYLPNLTQISDALGWAVLHSLWQGALAAVFVWVFRTITRESAADTRYLFGFITLCSLLVAFIGTFLYYYSIGGGNLGIAAIATEVTTLPLVDNAAAPLGNPLLRVTDYTSLVGAIWAGCFALLGMRYLSAFSLTHKLRTSGISDLPSDWQDRFNELAKRSNVTGKVRGFISEHVSSPITFGFWKPIVLVPAWFFSGLTPAQCEAVLLHEFAHIRRHDYLTNILQILVKTVLFYHPAVQYISKVMDTDREHACDDFAVLVTNSPEMLAKALGTIRLKAARDGGVFALSADGPEAPLMHRLKRLMGAPIKKTHSGSSRGFAATLMVAISSAMVLGLGASESLAHPHKADAEILAGGASSDSETLAGAGAENTIKINAIGSDFGNKIVFKGETYKATSFDFREDPNGYDVINGKPYPSKYMYSVYAKDGTSYVVKKKRSGKKYIEIDGNWYWLNEGETDGQKYAFSSTKIKGTKYKTKTNVQKNQTFININGNWYDMEKDNFDTLFPTPPATPTPPKYSYTYAYKDGQKYKIKTKNKSGKTYIRIDGNWQKATTSGGDDHGHRHVKIDGKWVNIVNTPPAVPLPPFAPQNNWINETVRRDVERAVEQANEQLERTAELREKAIERAEEQRERVFEQEMARAERQREQALERAEEQRERALEQAEAQRERTFAQAEAQRERAQEQRERESTQAVNYEEMRDRLIPALKKDGYLSSPSEILKMKMTKEDIFINGKLLPKAQESKYCEIVSHYGLRKNDLKLITISPNSFQISSIGDYGKTKVTIGKF